MGSPPPREHTGADREAVAGVPVDRRLVSGAARLPRVAIVAAAWSPGEEERQAAVRALAGALALSAEVVVVSLDDRSGPSAPASRRTDGIFTVHSVAATPGRAELARRIGEALSAGGPGRPLPELAAERLLGIEGRAAPGAVAMLDALEPHAVLLAGVETLWLASALSGARRRSRLAVMPLLGADPRLAAGALGRLLGAADVVLALSRTEASLLQAGGGAAAVRRLALPVAINEEAAATPLDGMSSFGPYLLVLSGWPDDGAAGGAGPPHDYVRAVLGDVAVAEVRRGGWFVSDGRHRFEFPFEGTRVNLWRLMAGAIAMLDVRPIGPVGREVVESLGFGTPVVVPAGTVAAEHAEASGGGLWYEGPGEMLEAARYFIERPSERERFSRAGRRWAAGEHATRGGFAAEVAALLLG